MRYLYPASFRAALCGAALVAMASSCSGDDSRNIGSTGPGATAGSGGENAGNSGGAGGGSSAGGASAGGVSSGGVSAGGAGGAAVGPMLDGGSPDAMGPRSVQEALDAFVAETGHTFVDCGDLKCPSRWTLPPDAGVPYSPGAEDDAAVSCFLDAWGSCTPAVVDTVLPCDDCPAFHVLSYVVPTDSGCKLVRFTDWSNDPLGGCTLYRDDCSELVDYGTTMLECPWFRSGNSCERSVALENDACQAL